MGKQLLHWDLGDMCGGRYTVIDWIMVSSSLLVSSFFQGGREIVAIKDEAYFVIVSILLKDAACEVICKL